jgi:hypothetical protein
MIVGLYSRRDGAIWLHDHIFIAQSQTISGCQIINLYPQAVKYPASAYPNCAAMAAFAPVSIAGYNCAGIWAMLTVSSTLPILEPPSL